MRALLTLALLLPSAAYAFCGFYVGGASSKLYNNATQVVMMRDGTRTVLAMQNNYQGPPENFAMVIPVPVILQKENVKTLTKDVFERIDTLDAPRLVEYWEQDPCRPEVVLDAFATGGAVPASAAPREADGGGFGVKIEAKFTVGEYEIVILSAGDSTGLEGWLKANKYNIPEGAAPVLKPYIEGGMKFFVAKVDPQKVAFNSDGQAVLSPLRFHYDAEQFALPIRLGMLNAKDKQDLIVHIFAKDRYEVANYTNIFIPTNLEVSEAAKTNFASFYAALFDKTLEEYKDADGRNPVITEYSWMAGTCDPCPGPAMQPEDALTLGGDVLPSYANEVAAGNLWPLTSLTLTRLHARYDQSSLGEDLIFKSATPVEGGREMYGAQNVIGATPSGVNNFQGRYIIRHAWTGDIKCANPQRGKWGGPPGDPWGMNQPMAAKDLAFASRGEIKLQDVLMSDVPSLNMKASPKKPSSSSTPGAKKKYEAGENVGGPSAKPSTEKHKASESSLPWGFIIAAIGGLILLALVFTSRPKH